MTGPTPGAEAADPPREPSPDRVPDGRVWRAWPVGARAIVRRILAEGGYSDVLGYLLEVDDDGVLVETRRGPVRVAAAEIAIGKLVPPPPPRRPRRQDA